MFTVKNYVYDGPGSHSLGEWDRGLSGRRNMVLLPDELDIIVDGLLADVRKVRIMFPQVVANAAAGNGGKTGKEGCDGLLVGMEFVMPFFVLEDFLQA
jgi:hypothetical protein